MAWKQGQSGNPSGRKRSNWRKHFDAVIAADTKKHKESIFEHAVKEARKDNTLLAAILRKMLPDLKAVDAKVTRESPIRLVLDFRQEPEQDTGPEEAREQESGT